MTTHEIEAWTDSDLTVRIVLLKALLDEVTAEFVAMKTLAGERWAKGSTLPARNGQDVKLGRVTKSDPKPVARVTDREAFEAYVYAEHPGELDTVVTLGEVGEILPILIDAGRTDLFTEDTVIPAALIARLEKAALTQPIPGITVRFPEGVVSAAPAEAAKHTVKRMLADRLLLALEEGK